VHPSRLTVVPTEPPIQWVPGSLFLGVKQPGCGFDHPPPSNTEVKIRVELYFYPPLGFQWPVLRRTSYLFTGATSHNTVSI
jgi:hypothetical protein